MKRLMLPVMLAVLALGCQKEGDTHLNLPGIGDVLTTPPPVTPPPTTVGSYVQCYADHGHGPSKWIHLPEDGTKNNLCYRDGVCFYGCGGE
jgi:hypothetical protein